MFLKINKRHRHGVVGWPDPAAVEQTAVVAVPFSSQRSLHHPTLTMDCSNHLEEMSSWLFPQKLAIGSFLLLPCSKAYLALFEEVLCVWKMQEKWGAPEKHRRKTLTSPLFCCTSPCCTKGGLNSYFAPQEFTSCPVVTKPSLAFDFVLDYYLVTFIMLPQRQVAQPVPNEQYFSGCSLGKCS